MGTVGYLLTPDASECLRRGFTQQFVAEYNRVLAGLGGIHEVGRVGHGRNGSGAIEGGSTVKKKAMGAGKGGEVIDARQRLYTNSVQNREPEEEVVEAAMSSGCSGMEGLGV